MILARPNEILTAEQRELDKQLEEADVAFTKESFDESYYGDYPPYNDIMQRFKQQPNEINMLSKNTSLLCEPSTIALFDDNAKAYAAPIGYEKAIHSELFSFLFSCFIREIKNGFNAEYYKDLDQLTLADDQKYKETTQG